MHRVIDLRRIDPDLRQLAADLARSLPRKPVVLGLDSIPTPGPKVTAESLGVPVKLVDGRRGHAGRRRRR